MRTTQQNENLAKLAKYLLSLPEDYDKFDMEVYNNSKPAASVNGDPIDCGSVACAIGHGPSAGIPLTSNVVSPDIHTPGATHINWQGYSEISFTSDSVEDDWLFAGEWSRVDDTAKGAAQRIAYLLGQGRSSYVVKSSRNVGMERRNVGMEHRLWASLHTETMKVTDLTILDRPEDWIC